MRDRTPHADTTRDRVAARVAALPGVRSVRRPGAAGTPAFDLGYVRTGPTGGTPVLVIPGGPGLGSVLPYRAFRGRAAAQGMDVLMVEHRGVGLSRRDVTGADLPVAAMTVRGAVDDLAAVLDTEGIQRVIVHGASYGSYLAQAFGAWHPGRVAGMVLDSVVASAQDHHEVRSHARRVLWAGDTRQTYTAARLLRQLVAAGVEEMGPASDVARIVYEFAGPDTLTDLVRARSRGSAARTWRWVAGLGSRETEQVTPFIMEFDLVGHLAVRELGYAPDPDGGPFDPATRFAGIGDRFGSFTGEPLDLAAYRPEFSWPVAVLSGDRDLRTPPPVARQVTGQLPDGALLCLPASGHSALDTHSTAALVAIAAVRDGTHHALASTPRALAAVRRTGASRHLGSLLRAGLKTELALPGGAASRAR